MFKVFLDKDKDSFTVKLEGSINIDETQIESYDVYTKRTQNELLKKEVIKYLQKVTGCGQRNVGCFTDFSFLSGESTSIEKLATFLVENK